MNISSLEGTVKLVNALSVYFPITGFFKIKFIESDW